MCLCNVYVSMQYLKINTYKGLNIFICFYARLLVWHTMLTKQGINIHAKAYKVIAMQYLLYMLLFMLCVMLC
ncbi:hypothetical protein HRAG_02288 [Helicobacter bilis ATCC 43879]|uniref:Uncharacterized protein n=1 Tax=Helicobacter bilis ATCC 43879 TaxID=613026 RepID=T5LPT3_9HELI|nr:hypothetical protein HRAG_02288 [Helicobacter bilis ATCC 43879]